MENAGFALSWEQTEGTTVEVKVDISCGPLAKPADIRPGIDLLLLGLPDLGAPTLSVLRPGL